jgi:hypothetical protein
MPCEGYGLNLRDERMMATYLGMTAGRNQRRKRRLRRNPSTSRTPSRPKTPSLMRALMRMRPTQDMSQGLATERRSSTPGMHTVSLTAT